MNEIFTQGQFNNKQNNLSSIELLAVSRQKENIEEIFKSNPGLTKIGTPEQYAQYLQIIFPDSKVKDIVWHGTPEGRVKEFNKDKQYVSKGFFFSDSLEHANKFATWKHGEPAIHGILLNIKNPLEETFIPSLDIKETKPQVVERAKKSGYDSLILDTIDLGVKINEYIVFESGQIHILGSENDLEKFKEFISQSIKNFD